MSVETDRLLGTDLAGFRLESVIGRGGMGVVYLAQDLRLKRRVALKLVAPELAADARFRERFLREAQLAASLDHSHIVPVHAAGETDGRLWIAMRYVQGTDLKSLLEREGPLEPARAVELCGQVGEALDAAHEHGLVHRDVKPANVLVTQEGGAEHCYLADFGLARSPDTASGPVSGTHLSGTVDYTAPEQIAREPADQRADVYSLGCVLYECLAGQPPFKRQRPVATLFAHANEAPPSLHEHRPELPEPVDQVIATGMAKEPAERYATCSGLVAAAREALGLTREPTLTRRALLVSAGGALVLGSAAAAPAILLTRGNGHDSAPKAILPLAGDSIVRIDPATATLTSAVRVSSADGVLAHGEGAVWLADKDRGVVSQIDPGTSAIVEEIEVPETSEPTLLAAGEGALWLSYDVANHLGDIWKYDFAKRRFALIDTNNVTIEGFATTPGALWTVCETFLRIDPTRGSIEATLEPVGGQGTHITATADAVWFAGSRDEAIVSGGSGRIWRGDPATSTLVETIDVDVIVADIAAGESAVWMLGLEDDLVRRIDPATSAVSEAFRVGRIPKALGVGAGAVWVTSSRDGTVTRYEPATADLKTIDVGGAAHHIVIGDGSVWVAVTA
jgi:tRNA A-37 threonylcarbamoyl transferase component Bud32/streptogramin lyase